MATISFFADTEAVQNLNGSGLGFFGSSFGNSVAVGAYQTTTYITDGNGTIEGPQVNNIQWKHPGSGAVNGGASDDLQHIPNRLATLNIRFTHGSAVRTQNVKFRVFDRSSINNDPSGVTCAVAELIHPTVSAGPGGSGDSLWEFPTGSSVIMSLVASPGMSGLRPNGPSTSADRHDWYLAISASPDSIGSKTQFAGYVELEYL